MPATYEPIATQTLGTAAASITFSSIPATYTDLRLVFVGITSASLGVRMQFNSDTGTNYSLTWLDGNGTTASSSARINQTNYFDGYDTGTILFRTFDIFSYAGSTFKTFLVDESTDNNGAGGLRRTVALWRSTSAINTINLFNGSTATFNAGTTATLYGIKAA